MFGELFFLSWDSILWLIYCGLAGVGIEVRRPPNIKINDAYMDIISILLYMKHKDFSDKHFDLAYQFCVVNNIAIY